MFEMKQQSLGIRVAFPAKRHIPVESVAVIKTGRLAFGRLDKSLAQFFECLKLSALHFEVRSNRYTFILGRHKFLSVEKFEQRNSHAKQEKSIPRFRFPAIR